MANARTTIMMNDILPDRVSAHIRTTGENLTDFYNRAIINQLENDGDWEIRDLIESEKKEKQSNGN